jgi:hypothetical protein
MVGGKFDQVCSHNLTVSQNADSSGDKLGCCCFRREVLGFGVNPSTSADG